MKSVRSIWNKYYTEIDEDIKKYNEILSRLEKAGTFAKFSEIVKEKDPYEVEKKIPKSDNYDFNNYNRTTLRYQAHLVVEIADRLSEMNYLSKRVKEQYKYFKYLRDKEKNIHPKILKFIEDYEEFYK